MTSKVDPDAYMKSGGGSTAIFSTLGMMLGAFGSTLARTPNFAQEFVNGQINRHIQAQEAQIQIKGKAADNMLADLTRETGSLQNGKLAMRQLLLEKASTEAQQIGARSKSQAVQAESDKTAAALAGQAAIADNMRKQGFLEHVMSSPIYYQRGSAGRTAGFITPTLDQVGTLQGQQLKARDQALQEEKLGVEKSKAAGGSAVSPERSGNINAAGEAIQAAMNIRSELEGRKVQGDAYDDPTRGLLDKVGNSQSNENINQNTTVLAKGVQSAFGKSDRDAADAEKMAAGGGSGRDRYQAAERIEKRLVGSIRTELTTLPPVQQKQLLDTLPADVRARVLGQ
jgi:hypothetical protein